MREGQNDGALTARMQMQANFVNQHETGQAREYRIIPDVGP
jgi:hypothetical protein